MERDLVVRAQGGDLDAFSALTAGRTSRLYAVARLILRDDEHAECRRFLVRLSGAVRPGERAVRHPRWNRVARLVAPTDVQRAYGAEVAPSGCATATTARPSMPLKSSGLQVYRGRSLAMAIAAIIAS